MKKADAISMLINVKKITQMRQDSYEERLRRIVLILHEIPDELPKAGRPTGSAKYAVSIDGVEYASVDEASRALKIYPLTIRNRCGSPSPKFKDWMYVYKS
jgi:hypothetical protein